LSPPSPILGLAALLVAVSGFLFGGGRERMRAGTLIMVAYTPFLDAWQRRSWVFC